LSGEEVRAAEEASVTLGERVRAGAAHSVERRRADVELANLKLEHVLLRSDAALARARLSSLWNQPEPRFERIAGALDSLPAEPHLDSLAVRAEASPAIARWQSEREARGQRLALERARRIPDLDAQFGVRRLGDVGGTTLIAGVAVPLPLFDRNAGAVDEAGAALSQVSSEEAEARLEVRRSLAGQHAALHRARTTLAALRSEVLPEAQRAFDDIQVGFERGRFTYLDLLEARRTLLRARREELQALLAAHLSIVAIERLIDAPLVAGAPRSGGIR
jgi:cobalt-zinc-cadmium efflux system outer membrane protein